MAHGPLLRRPPGEGRDGIRRIAGRHPTFRLGAMALLLALALTAPALGARAGYRVSESAPPRRRPGAGHAAASVGRGGAGIAGPKGHQVGAQAGQPAPAARGRPLGRRSTVARTLRLNAWWYSRNTAPNSRIIVRDHTGILSTYWEGRGLAVNPVATTGRWQDLNSGLTPEQLADALMPFAVRRHAAGRSFTVWEYYDVPDRPKLVLPGASGMAQGRIAQLMARAYHRTGEARFAKAAAGALAAFTVPVRKGGVVSRVGPSSAWYVERAFPGAGPWRRAERVHGDAAQPGGRGPLPHLTAAGPHPWPSRAAHPAARAGRRGRRRGREGDRGAGERTLARYLPLHDTGSWSLYGLATPDGAGAPTWPTRATTATTSPSSGSSTARPPATASAAGPAGGTATRAEPG